MIEKVGPPTLLIPFTYGKTVLKQLFKNTITGETEEYLLFDTEHRLAVSILALTQNQEVVVTRQFRRAPEKFILEMPGGGCDTAKETPEEAATRELLEETGYNPEKIVRIAEFMWADPASSMTFCHFFLALNCQKKSEPLLDKGEIITVELISLAKWLEMIYAGKVEDVRSIAMTFRALPRLGIKLQFP